MKYTTDRRGYRKHHADDGYHHPACECSKCYFARKAERGENVKAKQKHWQRIRREKQWTI